MASPNKTLWLRAALGEMIAITRMATFDLVLVSHIPDGRRPLPTKKGTGDRKKALTIMKPLPQWQA